VIFITKFLKHNRGQLQYRFYFHLIQHQILWIIFCLKSS